MNEALSTKDAKKLNKASALSYSSNPKDQDRARARQVDVDYKDLLRQINSRKKPNKPAVSKMKESFTIDKSAHKKAQKKSKMRNLAKGNTNPNEKAAAEKKAGGPKLYGEEKSKGEMVQELFGNKKYPYGKATKKNPRGKRDQAELDRAQEYIKKNPKFGIKEEDDVPRNSMGKPIRIKDKIKAAKGQIAHTTKVSEAKVDKGRSDYGKASIRNYRRSGPGHGEPAMFDPENKRGKLIDKRREEHKARRGVKKAKVPAYKVSEGKTFDSWKKAAASALGRKKEERKPQKAQDAGARAKRLLQRKEYASKVSGSTENVPDEMRD